MKSKKISIRKLAVLGVLLSLALILSYVEALIPFNFGIPGVKLGLANTMSVFILFYIGIPEAIIVNILRIVLSGFIFGNLFSIIYSLAGAFLSLAGMILLKRQNKFSIISISAVAAVLHNIGQYIVACFTVENYRIIFYLPVLATAGIFTGCIVGIIGNILVKRIPQKLYYSDSDDAANKISHLNSFCKRDVYFIGILLVLSLALTVVVYLCNKSGDFVEVRVNNEVYGQYSLNENTEIELECGNIITIINGEVSMTHATCPDKICIHQGSKSKNNECIVCLPNKVVVTVISSKENNIDSISG